MDTSVFGGVADEEFSQASQRFFQKVDNGEFVVLMSKFDFAGVVSGSR